MIKHICSYCKKEFLGKSKRKFCSKTCFCLAKKAETKEKIETGGVVDYRWIKYYLLEKNGNVCSICNLTEWLGKPIPLILDHIDGTHTHNTLKNCRLICHNCDALLPTYKNRNKGHGRFSRRQRYKQGQSY